MTAKEAQTLIRYTTWASHKILQAAQALPAEDRQRANGISHESIEGTVNHIFLADRIWFQRMMGSTEPVSWETTWDHVQTAWPELLAKWGEWAGTLTDDDTEKLIEYKLLNGNPGGSLVREIVTHLVNHGTLHRGQVMGMIRQLGVAPPPTDILWFYREQGQKA
jgi:uncharacterized damage-inducible protein DinB